MQIPTEPLAQSKPEPDVIRKQIRGSSLLLVGRGVSATLNFATQLLIVRYLSKGDYGAWAYALAFVAFFQAFSTFGLNLAITRFVPIYQENNEYQKLFGTLILVLITIFVVGFIVIGSIHAAADLFSRIIPKDQFSLHVILILIFLVPISGIDELLIGLFASFGRPRAIFFRKHLVGPTLKLTVVLLLIAFGSDVIFLAYGYLFASLAGISIYSWILLRVLHAQDIIQHFRLYSVEVPAKEIFVFTLPLLSTQLFSVAMLFTATLMLGYFHNTTEVASYQVIMPVAAMNAGVMHSFSLLYTPVAARLFAQHDFVGINNLYWRTAVWSAVLTFPVFALTFTTAQSLTLLFYGAQYEESALYLQMLAVAYYFNAALGMNSLTLKVMGKLRYVVTINLAALVINIVLNVLLIPSYGAMGAAISTAGTMIVHNIIMQAGLGLAAGLNIFNWQYSSFYGVIVIALLVLLLVQHFVTRDLYIVLPVGALVSLMVIKLCQRHLKIEATFPELLKVPFITLIIS